MKLCTVENCLVFEQNNNSYGANNSSRCRTTREQRTTRLFKGFKILIVIFSFLNITNTKINFYQVSHIPLLSSRPTAPRSVPEKSTTTHKTALQVLTNKRFTGGVRKENAWVGMQSPYLWQHYKCGSKDCSHQKKA